MAKGNRRKKKDDLGNIKDISLDYNPNMPKDLKQTSMDKDKREKLKKTRKQLEGFQKKARKKYNFIFSIGIIPPQAADKFEEEERVPKEEREKKPINVIVLIPEEKFKQIRKIRADLIKMVQDVNIGQNVWLHVKTPVDVWNYCLDGKYDMASAVAMSFPLYDEGFLGSLRLAEIHKSLVLKKFERYVTSYFFAGSFVTGKASKTSDVDVYIIIDDTDVKRMPRLQLKEKLRSIIYQYEMEARELAGVKNHLHIQTYILTEFWDGVKDANPVFFTVLRDGIPLYDRGTFMPWKLLLKMGKLTPSPEAIDKFMRMGDKMSDRVGRMLTDIFIKDIYWGVITPSQAMLMLYGSPPPTHKETPRIFHDVFVKKEKLIEKKYSDILKKIVKTYKDFEHKKIKDGDIKGKDIDKFLKQAEEFNKRLKKLRKQIEKGSRGKIVEKLYGQVFDMLKNIFNKKSEKKLISSFEEEFIEKGKLPKSNLEILKEIAKIKKKQKQGKKLKREEVEDVRKKSRELLSHLIEHQQRKELRNLEKSRMQLKVKDKKYELILTEPAFLIQEGGIKKIDLKNKKLKEGNEKELNEALNKQKDKKVKVKQELFSFLEEKLGKFEIVL